MVGGIVPIVVGGIVDGVVVVGSGGTVVVTGGSVVVTGAVVVGGAVVGADVGWGCVGPAGRAVVAVVPGGRAVVGVPGMVTTGTVVVETSVLVDVEAGTVEVVEDARATVVGVVVVA